MEEPEVQEEQGQKRETLFSRSQIIIIAIFALLNVGILLAVFGARIFAGGSGEGEEARRNQLEGLTLIPLGRIEVSMPIDSTHQNFIRCSANISLQVPSDRQQALEPVILQNEAVFKELARRAFRNAKPQDVAIENVAGVKNTIQQGINDLLGEDAIQEVFFGDYRSY
ncbi:MAG: hypothetical protein ACYTAN_01570 [Planctomycetota bacterium]|jgi:flagellar basal body-associated protein FliL